ncbi:MAG TPA: TIGR04282 family arsenosugar biosynthesis glycosyltransferase [Rubrobacteraceae bacterium]|nr:TIGR04282 family arsenosugar biosynthesis glycosyltransferase [Rubrobacteraceae bacterium]
MTDVLYVIAKAPRVGFAKTRLGKSIGHGEAIELYKAFLKDLATRFADVPFGFGWYITPPDAWPEISALTGEAERLIYQGEGDLTDRQRQLFCEARRRGERAVLIGSDTPHLDVEMVEEAFRSLDTHDLVFVPTYDGGYSLIGMSGPHYEVLKEVKMSTGSELDGIINRAKLSSLSVKLLETTFDVDEEEDLHPLRELALEREDLIATREALEKHGLLEPEPASNDPKTEFFGSRRKKY